MQAIQVFPSDSDLHHRLRQLAFQHLDADVFEHLIGVGPAIRLGSEDLLVLAAVLREGARRLAAQSRRTKPTELPRMVEYNADIGRIVAFETDLLARSDLPKRASGSTAFRAYFSALIGWYRAAHGSIAPAQLRAALEDLVRLDLAAVPEREQLIGLIADIGRQVPLGNALDAVIGHYYERPYLFSDPPQFIRVLVYWFNLSIRQSDFDSVLTDWLSKWCRYFGVARLAEREALRLLRRDKVHLRLGSMISLRGILFGRYGGWRPSAVLLLIKIDSQTFARWQWVPNCVDRPWISFLRSRFRRWGRSWLATRRLPTSAGPRLQTTSQDAAFGQAGLRINAGPEIAGTRRDILITRVQGGLGDIMMMRPALLRLAERLRQGRVVFATNRAYFPAFSADDPLDLVNIEHARIEIASFRRWNNLGEAFESEIESGERPNIRTNRIDIFARVLRVPFSRLNRARVFPVRFSQDNDALATTLFERHARPGLTNIAVQLRSAESYRDVPAMINVVRRLAEHNNVFVFDNRPIPRTEADRFVAIDNQSLPVAMAMVTKMDAVIAPDSAYVHLAGANRIPCLALFGPTGGRVRTRNYPSVRYLDLSDTLACVPCWRNENEPCALADNYDSVCLRSMTVPTIVQAFEAMMRDHAVGKRRHRG